MTGHGEQRRALDAWRRQADLAARHAVNGIRCDHCELTIELVRTSAGPLAIGVSHQPGCPNADDEP